MYRECVLRILFDMLSEEDILNSSKLTVVFRIHADIYCKHATFIKMYSAINVSRELSNFFQREIPRDHSFSTHAKFSKKTTFLIQKLV